MAKNKALSLKDKVRRHLDFIYPELDGEQLTEAVINTMELDPSDNGPKSYRNIWNQRDVITITYGDSLVRDNEKPLVTLKKFLWDYLKPWVNGVHILPFFPWSSDDGFSVIHYKKVNESLGDWPEIEAIADDYKLMADLVINHCSSRSAWLAALAWRNCWVRSAA